MQVAGKKLICTNHPLPLTPTLSLEWERVQLKTPVNLKPFPHSRGKVPDRADEGQRKQAPVFWRYAAGISPTGKSQKEKGYPVVFG